MQRKRKRMRYCKLQIACFIIVWYVIFIYIQDRKQYKDDSKDYFFKLLVKSGIISILFDGITAYTVNRFYVVPLWLNNILHMCFLLSLDTFVFVMFRYLMEVTECVPRKKRDRIIYLFPFVINIGIVVLFITKLEYRRGKVTWYSMGISAYTCFAMVIVYMLASVVIFLKYKTTIELHKRITIATYLIATIGVTIFQIRYPQALVTCLVPTIAIIGAYLNLENPLFVRLQKQHDEMVMGFATLIESRDQSTGGHIRRTTKYVELLAKEAAKEKIYKEILTKDYIQNLIMAAPMHDIGKVTIPDAILQKAGKLTTEEYKIMKTHAEKGSEIIKSTFGSVGDEEYKKIAYEVAYYHHEKWNGSGYPTGKKADEIPLCARIMAIADVFDALSSSRCYKEPMPLKQCFEIIKNDAGQEFDPFLAEIFLQNRRQIEKICEENNGKKEYFL